MLFIHTELNRPINIFTIRWHMNITLFVHFVSAGDPLTVTYSTDIYAQRQYNS